MAPVEHELVSIPADGVNLAGHLHRPTDAPDPLPGVVFSGPLTGVKEQVSGRYAAQLAQHGFACLAFDHQNYGESDGSPRQHEDPPTKLVDLRAATGYLARQDDVSEDALAAVGVCLGTSYILCFSAFDPRIKAVSLVAGAYNDPSAFREILGPKAYRAVMEQAADAWTRYDAGAALETIPAVSEDETEEVAMPGSEPWAYYGTDRGRVPSWENEITSVSIAALMRFDAMGAAPFLEQPALFVHGEKDDYCSPKAARSAFEKVPDPKQWTQLPAEEHIDLYDVDEHVDEAVAKTADWFHDHLVPRKA